MSLLYEDNPTEYIVSTYGKFGADEIIDELIRCKDCTYFDYGVNVGWCCCHDVRMLDCDYCSRAIRKDEEE